MTGKGYDEIDTRVSALLGAWHTEDSDDMMIARIMATTTRTSSGANDNLAGHKHDVWRLKVALGSIAAMIMLSVGTMLWMRDFAPLPTNEPILDQDAFHVFFTTKAQASIEEDLIR